jgi:hypothetical protein
MRTLRAALWLAPVSVAAAGGPAGCFPYRQAYRPEVSGMVVDRELRPVAGAEVVACTSDGWESARVCRRRAEARTGADGRFSLPPHTEWDWCCFGEAPRPRTDLTACARDAAGQWLQAPPSVIAGAPTTDQRLQLAPVGPAAPPTCQPR